ncbi:MAG: glucose-6-phosphate dehydrogenase [Cyanobacteria bacterium SZAS LIN-2]|nr:glucose-6-phosphate dehydrogenase [Cyanobacteria bacterium SZAS LIN-2]
MSQLTQSVCQPENTQQAITQNQSKPAPPCTLVIFGGAGDLTKRLLIPSIYNLQAAGLLPENFAIIGVARADKNDEQFRADLSEEIKAFATTQVEETIWKQLINKVYYLRGNFDEAPTYEALKLRLDEIEKIHNTGKSRLYYLATGAEYFPKIAELLGQTDMVKQEEGVWRRVIVEKPFGTDLQSAEALNRSLLSVLEENQIYRIDHYLGKETVQNILVFRFANGLFEPLWNNKYVDSVQITVVESVGVENRGNYYDKSGALRDMVPNHLFQLLTMTAMEPPTSFQPDAVRSEKAKVLQAIHPLTDEQVRTQTVRGQYSSGVIKGKEIPDYRNSPKVNPQSETETFVAMKLFVDNWRWAGVPFYLRTGKCLPKKRSEIVITFKKAPFSLFRGEDVGSLEPNNLILHIQPEEGISLEFGAKIPGPKVMLSGVEMDFNYHDYFGQSSSTGYETLIYDCMIGDATLFQRADNTELGWKVVDPMLKLWQSEKADFPNYVAGSNGPAAADELLSRDGRAWRPIK